MSFIDKLICLWVILPTFMKIVYLILLVIGSCLCLVLLVGDRNERGVGYFLGSLLVALFFISPFFIEAPTTSQLKELYENGDINRNVFKRFAPYSLMKDREIKKQEEDRLREQREQIAKEEAEVRFKKEQREYRREDAEKILGELKQNNQNNKEKR